MAIIIGRCLVHMMCPNDVDPMRVIPLDAENVNCEDLDIADERISTVFHPRAFKREDGFWSCRDCEIVMKDSPHVFVVPAEPTPTH